MTTARKKTLALSIFTVGYNVSEGTIAVVASSLAGSSTLLVFGLDSFVESLSGTVMIWRFWKYDVESRDQEFEVLEKRASRLVACSFFILAAHVVFEAGSGLESVRCIPFVGSESWSEFRRLCCGAVSPSAGREIAELESCEVSWQRPFPESVNLVVTPRT